jgi:hypothetical protein
MSDGNEPRKDERPLGRDEMNLAEFPIALLTDQPLTGVKTLVFEDRHGKLTISGSDAYGLPTAPDSDVIVALLHLTKTRNDFTDPTVPFTRYELLKLLGWPDRGHYYQRLDESLNRWIGVTLYYEKAWWDNEVKCRVDAKFHILESVVLFDREVRRTLRARHQPLPSSSFTWNKVFFKSCRDGNLKSLDVTTYFGLRSAVSKQMYRFLDKRFYLRPAWTFDLRELAFEHVGLSRNYAPRKVKEKLQPALEELEGVGVLEAMTAAERYIKVGRGEWQIRLVHKRTPTPVEAKPEPEPADLEAELVHRGVTRNVAAELVRDFPADRIESQIEHVDRTRRKIRDKSGFLVSAIRGNFAPPREIDPPAQAAPAEARRARNTRATRNPADDLLSEADLAHWRRVAAEGDRVQARLARLVLTNHEQAEAARRRA